MAADETIAIIAVDNFMEHLPYGVNLSRHATPVLPCPINLCRDKRIKQC